MQSDIKIAQGAKLQPISEIAAKLGVSEENLSLYGRYKAKINHRSESSNKNPGKVNTPGRLSCAGRFAFPGCTYKLSNRHSGPDCTKAPLLDFQMLTCASFCSATADKSFPALVLSRLPGIWLFLDLP